MQAVHVERLSLALGLCAAAFAAVMIFAPEQLEQSTSTSDVVADAEIGRVVALHRRILGVKASIENLRSGKLTAESNSAAPLDTGRPSGLPSLLGPPPVPILSADPAERRKIIAERLNQEVLRLKELHNTFTEATDKLGLGAEEIAAILVDANSVLSRIQFSIRPVMHLGDSYEAKLAIFPPQADPRELLRPSEQAPIAFSTEANILPRVRGILAGGHFQIDKLSDEWQRMSPAAPAFWVWRVEPKNAGSHELVVTLQHSVHAMGQDRIFNVQHFPYAITVQVGWWAAVKSAVVAVPPAIQATITAGTAVGAIITGLWAWYKRKTTRRRGKRASATRAPSS